MYSCKVININYNVKGGGGEEEQKKRDLVIHWVLLSEISVKHVMMMFSSSSFSGIVSYIFCSCSFACLRISLNMANFSASSAIYLLIFILFSFIPVSPSSLSLMLLFILIVFMPWYIYKVQSHLHSAFVR